MTDEGDARLIEALNFHMFASNGDYAFEPPSMMDAEAVVARIETLSAENRALAARVEVAVGKLQALRVMCDSCNQPLYVEVLDEVLEALSPQRGQ